MKTEVKPRINSAFFISDIELTRIKDAQNEQIKKIAGGKDAIFDYEVKYRNGVISNPNSISDILSEENDGSKAVIRLIMKATSPDDAETYIELKFSDTSEKGNSDDIPISYSVLSSDKDWTFVSASTIDERINKIKTSKILYSITPSRVITVMYPLAFLLMIIYIYLDMQGTASHKLAALKNIRSTSRSLIEYIYRVDLLNINKDPVSEKLPLLSSAVLIVLLFITYLLDALKRWYPFYTFYWGDGTKKYDVKIAVVKFVAIGIILALILGVLGNYISNKIF